MSIPSFKQLILQGEDAGTFLQGQITANINKLTTDYLPTAIANLKGRIQFGIWIRKNAEDTFAIIISSDCVEGFTTHIKKYGAFSKFALSEAEDVYPCLERQPDDESMPLLSTFSTMKDRYDIWGWIANSMATGNYWITADTQDKFQPQELRLHQRHGVDYDKGCYLGQEVIARLYFKATPKAFLHRVNGKGATPEAGERLDKMRVVNAMPTDNSLSGEAGFEALVVARPDDIDVSDLQVLPLPPRLQESVARPT